MFLQAGQFHVAANAPNEHLAWFLNTQDNAIEQANPAGSWLRIPLPIPAESVAVLLGGLLLITESSPAALCDLQVAVRKPGSPNVSHFWQCIEATAGGGQRSPVTAAVAVSGGAVELRWTKSPAGVLPDWPTAPAFGVNLSVMGYWL